MTTHLVTGASGQLGQLTIAHLATLVDPAAIVALVRSDEAAARFAAQGIQTRRGDYTDSASLAAAFAGVDRVLLISSSEMEDRVAQHKAVIDAAKTAGVAFLAYTSVLHAPENPMILARDHAATEAHLRASGLAHTVLRNGWYVENYLGSAAQALASGQLFGAAGTGRIAGAARDDYALAAARVLHGGHDGAVLELAGDDSFTMDDLAAALADLSGKPIAFVNLPEAALVQGLIQAGLPEAVAAVVADADARSGDGALLDESRTLSRLIGRPTTPWRSVLGAALAPQQG
jgi:NAD(P)H dehydrogenase (quinone)